MRNEEADRLVEDALSYLVVTVPDVITKRLTESHRLLHTASASSGMPS